LLIEDLTGAAREAIEQAAAEAARAAALASLEREAAAMREAQRLQGENSRLKRSRVKTAIVTGAVCLFGGLAIGAPSWELTRWGVPGLRFVPPDDEGFVLRGHTQRLVYKGRRRSHRFTILGDTAFEYDIILNREPESNRLYLAIEGWEGFDFFRQPDDTGPAILRGSYAVYKKAGVISSPAYPVGTGKLCHIHRPRVIDARGRRTWGDIRIDRGMLTMTVPEGWLADAAYPVTVDPVIGSGTIGAYSHYPYISVEYYQYYLDDREADPDTELAWYTEEYAVEFDTTFIFNQYTLPVPLGGAVTARVYINSIPPPSKYYTPVYGVLPVIYGDSGNKPGGLLTEHTTPGNPTAQLADPKYFTPRWVESTLTLYGTVGAGTGIWFGYWGEAGTVRFDYGAPLFQTYDAVMDLEALGEYSSFYEMAPDYTLEDLSYCEDRFSSPEEMNVYPGARYDMKVSMYVEALPRAYTRTVYQGVGLNDARKQTGSYRRSATQTVRGATEAKGSGVFYRGIVQTVTNTVILQRFPTLIRKLAEAAAALYETRSGAGFIRGISDTAGTGSIMRGITVFFRTLFGRAGGGDSAHRFSTRMRILQNTGTVGDETGHTADYLRGLFAEAGSMAETTHKAEYQRKQQDTTYSEAVSLRHLFIFIRLLTGSYIRDYITGRFLKSREEIVIKSPVCRELTLDSKI
jgi:hypothetical protein